MTAAISFIPSYSDREHEIVDHLERRLHALALLEQPAREALAARAARRSP